MSIPIELEDEASLLIFGARTLAHQAPVLGPRADRFERLMNDFLRRLHAATPRFDDDLTFVPVADLTLEARAHG